MFRLCPDTPARLGPLKAGPPVSLKSGGPFVQRLSPSANATDPLAVSAK
jgi:hypothetical protein